MAGAGEGERENPKKLGMGLDYRTLRSGPELKSRVGHSTDCAIQATSHMCFYTYYTCVPISRWLCFTYLKSIHKWHLYDMACMILQLDFFSLIIMCLPFIFCKYFKTCYFLVISIFSHDKQHYSDHSFINPLVDICGSLSSLENITRNGIWVSKGMHIFF